MDSIRSEVENEEMVSMNHQGVGSKQFVQRLRESGNCSSLPCSFWVTSSLFLLESNDLNVDESE